MILLAVRIKSRLGTRAAIAIAALLLAISASVHLAYTLTVGLALVALVATSHFGGRAENIAAAPVQNRALLRRPGRPRAHHQRLLNQVRHPPLYHACAEFDVSLYLWPTLALAAAVAFSLSLAGFGLAGARGWRRPTAAGDSASDWGE